jgi:hypothetical protein
MGERVVRQTALDEAIPESGKSLVPLGIGHADVVRATRADIVRCHHIWIIGAGKPQPQQPART